MKNTKNIMILGGYGRVGLELARLLLRYSPHDICLAGRDHVKASRAARVLNSEYSRERVRGVEVNVALKIQLAAALDGCDLVIDAIRETAFEEQMVRAAVDAGIDCITLSTSTGRRLLLKKLDVKIQAAGLTFIREAGLATGAPSLMARYLAGYFDAVDTVVTDCLTEGKALNYRDRADLIVTPGESPMTSGDESGSGWSFAGTLRRQRVPWYRRFLPGSGSVPDPGQVIAVKTKATGEMNGRREELGLTIEHRVPHRAAATAVVPCVLGILDGSIRQPGVHRMGCVLDPEKYMDDLWRMGATVSLKGLPDTWHEKNRPVLQRMDEMQTETTGLVGQVA